MTDPSKLVYEDENSVVHETELGGRISSLKRCSHGIDVWNNGWDLSLCRKCQTPHLLMRLDDLKRIGNEENPGASISEAIKTLIDSVEYILKTIDSK